MSVQPGGLIASSADSVRQRTKHNVTGSTSSGLNAIQHDCKVKSVKSVSASQLATQLIKGRSNNQGSLVTGQTCGLFGL